VIFLCLAITFLSCLTIAACLLQLVSWLWKRFFRYVPILTYVRRGDNKGVVKSLGMTKKNGQVVV